MQLRAFSGTVPMRVGPTDRCLLLTGTSIEAKNKNKNTWGLIEMCERLSTVY